MPFSYVISHRKLNLYVTLVSISDLHVHEETIPELLDKLSRSIEKDGFIKHPIIADKTSLVVLDGVHRVAALERLGYRWVPTCLIDYANSAVKVGCWYRTLKKINSLEKVAALITEIGSKLDKVDEIEKTSIGVSPIVAALKTSESTFAIRSRFRNVKQAYDVVERVEGLLRREGMEMGYETESDALRKLREKQIDGVILTPKLTKEAIVGVALSGEVFSSKATRHVIPARPLCVNVPLSLLRGRDKSLKEANRELEQMLRRRRVKLVASGSVFEGRRYEEDLYIFE